MYICFFYLNFETYGGTSTIQFNKFNMNKLRAVSFVFNVNELKLHSFTVCMHTWRTCKLHEHIPAVQISANILERQKIDGFRPYISFSNGFVGIILVRL